MNRSGIPGPDRLDTRADSPMRDEIRVARSTSSSNSPVHRSAPHGLPTPANDVPSSGFTAVNGESHRNTSFRPDESARRQVGIPNGEPRSRAAAATSSDTATTPVSYNPHNWRPGERHPEADATRDQQENGATNKRKRAASANGDHHIDDAREDQQKQQQQQQQPQQQQQQQQPQQQQPPPSSYASGKSSPKRRMLTLDSDRGPSSPDPTLQSRAATAPGTKDLPPAITGTYVREPSPVFRSNRAEPPPPPRPEVEAGLAASLQRSLDAEQQAQAAAQSASPTADTFDHQHSQAQSPDDGQQGDSLDPKKRKRNFSNRTKTGCHTCRARKKKCDEAKPTCENCRRGQFDCGGYGPKPPGGVKISAARTVVPLQAKQYHEQPHAPPGYYDGSHRYHPHGSPRAAATAPPPPPPWDPARPEAYPPPLPPQHRYGAPPGPPDHHRPPNGRDEWGPRPPWGGPEPPNSSYLSGRLPSVDFSNVPPPMHGYPPDRHPPPPDPWGHPHGPPPPFRAPPGPPTVVSSRESVTTTNSAATFPPMPPNGPMTEKMKMLTGQPFKHYLDDELIEDRQSCRRAVESYNNACAAISTALPPEKERHFQSIMNPRARTFNGSSSAKWTGPTGSCGSRTIVETPFACEYGYNIHLGNDSLIQTNCTMQDACPIIVGDRVIIGPNVKFYCMSASVDASLRQGSQGNFLAGAIRVEDDCYIGADVTILPFRTIGQGAVVGAGSVVTRDVKPYTVVAGNPAKPVRKRRLVPGNEGLDRHDDDGIQAENERMVEWMKKGFPPHGVHGGHGGGGDVVHRHRRL